jgi:hypothetical protein
MPYTPIDINRNRLKASAAPSHFTVKPQKDLCLRIYTLDLTDDGSPDYSKRVSPFFFFSRVHDQDSVLGILELVESDNGNIPQRLWLRTTSNA